MKIISFSIKEYFNKRESLQKLLSNSGWLFIENITRLGAGLLVSILIARYLGPEQFGMLSYALSVVTFLGTFTYLGLSGLVVRDIVRLPHEKELLLGSTFLLKSLGCLLAFLSILGISFFSYDFGSVEFWILLIVGTSLFAKPFEVIEFWFHSQVQAKYSVFAKISACLLFAVTKILLVFYGASLLSIALASAMEFVLASILLVYIYHYKGFSLFDWKIRVSKASNLLGQSWILILSGLLAMVNLKIDQVMLRWMIDSTEVGIYSVAVRFSEVWYFLPSVLVMSVFPKLISLKKINEEDYEKKLQQIFDLLFCLAFFVALLMTFIADPLIPFLYSYEYAQSSSILVIHVWAGIFMFMRALFSKWIIIEDLLVFSLISQGVGALVNVALNYYFISELGGKGAAIATLFSYATSSYLILFCTNKTRPVAKKMTKAIFFPVRILIYRQRVWS